jgi:Asp-tRNA(Asn)/Glu-tRNA(Gln) amidotransferase A subunit family amidase
MLSFEEYRGLDALGLAQRVRAGQITETELLDTALARARAVNPTLNAITVDDEAYARRSIANGLPNGPLAGVPFLLKDLGVMLKGTVTTGSLSYTRNLVARQDSTYVERCLKAGLVTFGKTHSPEFGLSPSSESRMWGATRNPWDLSRIAGGSSGGAAAAVAAGIVPVAHATDGGSGWSITLAALLQSRRAVQLLRAR